MSHKPNFFVVGAMKAGTTSLYHYLSQHPKVYLSPIKEPNYFSTDIDPENFSYSYLKNPHIIPETYFKKIPLESIHMAYIRKPEHYQMLFANVKNQTAIGEFSTSYLISTHAAKKIYSYNPKAKIIIILRNPIERIFSHYLMALRYSFTTQNFMDAVCDDIKREEKGWGISEMFIEIGLYASQLKLYLDIFPKDQIKILLFDDLKIDAKGLMENLCLFLEIKPYEFTIEARHNIAAVPKYKQLMDVMTKTGLKSKVGNLLPTPLKKQFKKALFTSNQLPELSIEEKSFLLDIFKDDIKKTSNLINRDLSEWLIV